MSYEFNRHEDSVAMGNVLTQELDEPVTQPLFPYDETLRDGEQTVGVAFTPEQKIEIALSLVDAGIPYMTIGFPAVSEVERETVRAILAQRKCDTFYCFSRATKEDVQAVIDCGIGNVSMFIPISDNHLRNKLRMTIDQAEKHMRDQISLAKSHGLRVRFAFEDATRSPLERIKRFSLAALEAGASAITVADTCGIMTPMASYRLAREMKKTIGYDTHLAVHFHDDHGMATANAIAAAAGGANLLQGALVGLGERAGNARLEEIAAIVKLKLQPQANIDLRKLMTLANKVAGFARFPLGYNKALLGKNVFSHESGIHVNGIMHDAATYEPFPPELIGRSHEVHHGKHSGLSNLKYVMAKHQIEVGDDDLKAILVQVKRLAEQGASPSEADVVRLMKETSSKPTATSNRG